MRFGGKLRSCVLCAGENKASWNKTTAAELLSLNLYRYFMHSRVNCAISIRTNIQLLSYCGAISLLSFKIEMHITTAYNDFNKQTNKKQPGTPLANDSEHLFRTERPSPTLIIRSFSNTHHHQKPNPHDHIRCTIMHSLQKRVRISNPATVLSRR